MDGLISLGLRSMRGPRGTPLMRTKCHVASWDPAASQWTRLLTMCCQRVRDLCGRATFCDGGHASLHEWLSLALRAETVARASGEGARRVVVTTLAYHSEPCRPSAASAPQGTWVIVAPAVFREISIAVRVAHRASAPHCRALVRGVARIGAGLRLSMDREHNTPYTPHTTYTPYTPHTAVAL